MQHITGTSCHQMRISSLEDAISSDNQVRFIDAFVSHIDLVKLGFKLQILKKEGHPSYQTQLFLKIYLYGYLNGILSSENWKRKAFETLKYNGF